MQENRKIGIVLIIGLIFVGIAGTVILVGRGSVSEEVVNQPVVVEDLAMEDTIVPAATAEQEAETAQVEITEVPAIPTARAGLEASDPASVNLANGNIQLVEAFAFW